MVVNQNISVYRPSSVPKIEFGKNWLVKKQHEWLLLGELAASYPRGKSAGHCLCLYISCSLRSSYLHFLFSLLFLNQVSSISKLI